MALAKTKTKVIRYLLIEALEKRKISAQELSKIANIEYSAVYNIINCRRDGELATWRKIQEALSLKDNEMWAIINTTKRVYR